LRAGLLLVVWTGHLCLNSFETLYARRVAKVHAPRRLRIESYGFNQLHVNSKAFYGGSKLAVKDLPEKSGVITATRHNASLRLTNIPQPMRGLMKMTNLLKAFEIFETEEEAMEKQESESGIRNPE
jgi:hypothetical protein